MQTPLPRRERGRPPVEVLNSIGIPRMNPELAWMVAIFWIGRKPMCEVYRAPGTRRLKIALHRHSVLADHSSLPSQPPVADHSPLRQPRLCAQPLGGGWQLDVSYGKETVAVPVTARGIAGYAAYWPPTPAEARRPPAAAARPGNPTPTIGPGTATRTETIGPGAN